MLLTAAQAVAFAVLAPAAGVASADYAPAMWAVVVVGSISAVGTMLRARDSHQRRIAVAALRASEQRHRALVERTPDGVLVVRARQIVLANQAAHAIFALPEGSLLGRSVRDFFDLEERRRLDDAILMAVAGRRGPDVLELQAKLDESDVRLLEVACGAYDGAEGVATVLIVRDVTRRREVEAAARRSAEQEHEIARLRREEDARKRMLNATAHELNTPIAALRLQTYMLSRRVGDDDVVRAAVGVLDRNVQRLARIVGDILQSARQEAGTLRLVIEPADIKQVVSDVCETFAIAAADKGVKLVVQDRLGHRAMQFDAARLFQVVSNLVSNALKFAPDQGRIEIILDGPEDGWMRIRVRDDGLGLTQEQMSRLFVPFSQVHETSRMSEGGTGLGLHISRGIVEGHGGKMTCASAGPSRGATFSVLMPLAARPVSQERAPTANI